LEFAMKTAKEFLLWALVMLVVMETIVLACLLPGMPTLENIAAAATAAGFFGIVVALWLQREEYKHARQVANRDATEGIFRRWWGLEAGYPKSEKDKKEEIRRDLPSLRTYFYREFIPWYKEHGPRLGAIRLKDFANRAVGFTPSLKDEGRLANLTFFFDEVGWLGAAGLIDVNHVLGPMQHVLRRVWWVSKPWIELDRKRESGYWLDPVRHFGIEWLYQKSVITPQIDLIKDRFRDLPPLSHVIVGRESNIQELRTELAKDKAAFLSILPEQMRARILNYDETVLSKYKQRSGREHTRLVQTLLESRRVAAPPNPAMQPTTSADG
jgi:hypothetical protein